MGCFSRKWLLIILIFLSIILNASVRFNSLFIPALGNNKELKSFIQDKDGVTYLLEIDSYRWYRWIDNFINTGHYGTSIKNHQEHDDLMRFPLGYKVLPQKLHYYSGVLFFKALRLIDKGISLVHCLSLYPALLSSIMVLAVFIISILFGLTFEGGFVASLIIGLSPLVLQRTSFGWFDTDIYNVFMPLVIALTLAHYFKKRTNFNPFLYLSGVLIGVYSALWSTWWLIFYIILLILFIHEVNIVVYKQKSKLSDRLKHLFVPVLIFISCAYLSVFLISGFDAVITSFKGPFVFLRLKGSLALDNFWPNIGSTISELSPPNAKNFSYYLGGNIVLFGGLAGLLLLFRDDKYGYEEKGFLRNFLIFWTLIMFVLSCFTIRFFLFLNLSVGILFVVFIERCIRAISANKRVSAMLNILNTKRRYLILKIFLLLIACVFLIPWPFSYPVVYNNDSWMNVTAKIKESTPKNALIAAWWEEGDIVMTLGRRATLSDASDQFTPVPYWMSRVFLSQNETEAVGILRMLGSGSYLGFEELTKLFKGNKFTALEVIEKLILLKSNDGEILLKNYLSDKEAIERVMKLMYGSSVPTYLLVHNHLLNVSETLSRLASWDFRKADLISKLNKMSNTDCSNYAVKNLNYSRTYSQNLRNNLLAVDTKDILNWIVLKSEQYRLYTDFSNSYIVLNKNLLLFNNNILVDMASLKAYFRNGNFEDKWMPAGEVIYASGESTKENINKNGAADCVVFISNTGNGYKAILCGKSLVHTLFFKLFYQSGSGLKHFKLANREYKEGFADIYLYKVDLSN